MRPPGAGAMPLITCGTSPWNGTEMLQPTETGQLKHLSSFISKTRFSKICQWFPKISGFCNRKSEVRLHWKRSRRESLDIQQ